MPSPFPGMNPYLEQEEVWHDFHERFVPAISDALVPQVRPGYIVKIDEHVYIRELPAEERYFVGRGDVSITRSGSGAGTATVAGALEAPAYGRVPVAVDIERYSYLEIRDRRDRELVTVIELLSP